MKKFTMRFKSYSEFFPNVQFYFTGNHMRTNDQYEIVLNRKAENGYKSDADGNTVTWIKNYYIIRYAEVNR